MKLKIPTMPPTPFLREALVSAMNDGLYVDSANVVECAVDTTLDLLVWRGSVGVLSEDVVLEELVVLEEIVVLKEVVVLNEVGVVVSSVSAVIEVVSSESAEV
jgi:hypothetical protein